MLLRIGVYMMGLALASTAVVAIVAFLDRPMEPAAAVKSTSKPAVKPLARSDPGVDPWVEERVPLAESEPEPRPRRPEPEKQTEPKQTVTVPEKAEPRPERETVPKPEEPKPEEQGVEEPGSLPVEEADWPAPTEEQVEAANRPRRYELAPGALLGLTIDALGLYDVPVLDSDDRGALDNGVVHVSGTSMPWSRTPERNVYIAGHRLGWPGTGSHLVFYRLNDLADGDEILLRDRDGRRYKYRVIDSFAVDPEETWVMGRVRGRDLLTLQTCTPIPTFHKRLIIRGERI